MPTEQSTYNNAQIGRAVEASIHIGLTILLTAACILILFPFIPLIAWGIIIAVASYPAFRKLEHTLGGRGGLAAVVWTLIFLGVLILPVVLLGKSMVEFIQNVTTRLREGTALIPPPPATVENWPVIGPPLNNLWTLASRDLSEVIRKLGPQIKSALPGLLSASAGIGLTVVQFVLSILLAGVLLANAQAAYEVVRSLAIRLFGEKGPEFQELLGSTIRSVTFGILGVAVIQSVCAALGFLIFGLPGAGAWSAIFLFAAVLQVGIVVLIPAVIYAFAIASTTKAVVFLIWCLIVGLMDNVLKPMLLGRGVAVPVVVVFLGAIGGFIAIGFIGLFVGAVVLSVGYKLFLAWLGASTARKAAAQS